MVGSDPAQFKDLADETKLPEDRRQSCQKDYGKISISWDTVLKPHRRAAEQPKTNIEVTYGDGKGNLDAYAKGFRDLSGCWKPLWGDLGGLPARGALRPDLTFQERPEPTV